MATRKYSNNFVFHIEIMDEMEMIMEEMDVIYDEKDEPESIDWDAESDTSEEFPDPNDSTESLYQDKNKLPELLRVDHFEEGMIYAATLDRDHKVMMLGMIIELKDNSFLLRSLFHRGAKRKTYHEGAKDVELRYSEVWRLAPRRELVRRTNPSSCRIGQTLRFEYGIGRDTSTYTVLVTQTYSRNLKGLIECGADRGKEEVFALIEIAECTEVFGSSRLQSMLGQSMGLSWSQGTKTKTKKIPERKPRLSPNFMVPTEIAYKRKWHVMKILGEGAEILCTSTNARAKRKLSRSRSQAWKKR